MSEDWEAGDLALCVGLTMTVNGKTFTKSKVLRVGAIYTVRHTRWSKRWDILALGLNEVRSNGPHGDWPAAAFRKIRPLTDEERREAMRDLREPVA